MRASRWALVAVGLLLPASFAALPAAAGSAPAAPAAAPRCTFRASGSPSDEWGSCMQVRAALDSVPAAGQTATVEVTVRSQAARPAAEVTLDVPAGVSFVTAGSASLSTEAAGHGQGTVRRASVTADLTAGSVHRYSYAIRPAKAGPVHLHLGASYRASANVADEAEGDLLFTVGATPAGSHLGVAQPPTTSAAAPVPAGTAIARTRLGAVPQAKLAPVSGTPSQDEPAGSPGAPGGQGCVTGGWFYVDNLGVTRPATNATVEAWDHDSASGDDLLAFGVVGFNGRYSLCFSSDDGVFDSTQEVYIHVRTNNTRWQVRNNPSDDDNFVVTSGTADVCDGCDRDFGNLQPADTTNVMPAFHVFDALNDLWLFVQGGSQSCFDRNDTTCKPMIANWQSTNPAGSAYRRDLEDIQFAGNAPNSPFTLVHEGSHALMDDAYEDAMPVTSNCNPHDVPTTSSTTCAWVEGFAEWLPARVYNNSIYQYPSGTVISLESPTWATTGWNDGDNVEGRIAGTLIDLSDAANESPWDTANEGNGPVYTTFVNTVSNTLNEFLTVDRVNQGFEFSDALARSATYQNTIDYDFRDPLVSRVEKARTTPVPSHNYVLNTTSSFWSVVGTRQSGDYDLNVYDNRNLTGALASSSSGGNAIDFVAIDTNRRAAGDYYPRVNPFNGATGTYGVEYVQGNLTVPDGTHSIFFGGGDVINVEDTQMSPGVNTAFRIVPSVGLDVEAFLVRSDGANAATFVQGRASAVRASNVGGTGVAESFTYADAASQWDGLVVTNKGGSGTYTVYRDTSAPSGALAINGGGARTNIRDVTANLSAADGQTGVYQMRVAFDGTLDTEPWIAYSPTLAGVLPNANGTRTVRAQFRNNALLESPVVSDTIVLDRRPNLSVTAVSNPPASVKRGKTFSVTDTTRNSGPMPTGTATQTRYYLSTDKVKSAGDILLAGNRAVPNLAVFTSNSGSKVVTVPGGAATVQYYVIACSDATNAVAEFSETDNCRASATKVKVNT